MKKEILYFILSFLVGWAFTYPSGAPSKACDNLVPSKSAHKASPSNRTSPYTLSTVVVEETLMLTLEGVPPFRGFALQVRFSSNNGLAGEFSWDEEETEHVKYMKCDLDTPRSSITQSKARAREKLVVFWSWPDTASLPQDGDYVITYTALENKKLFWVKSVPAVFSAKAVFE